MATSGARQAAGRCPPRRRLRDARHGRIPVAAAARRGACAALAKPGHLPGERTPKTDRGTANRAQPLATMPPRRSQKPMPRPLSGPCATGDRHARTRSPAAPARQCRPPPPSRRGKPPPGARSARPRACHARTGRARASTPLGEVGRPQAASLCSTRSRAEPPRTHGCGATPHHPLGRRRGRPCLLRCSVLRAADREVHQSGPADDPWRIRRSEPVCVRARLADAECGSIGLDRAGADLCRPRNPRWKHVRRGTRVRAPGRRQLRRAWPGHRHAQQLRCLGLR
jgi:hypothetical protein